MKSLPIFLALCFLEGCEINNTQPAFPLVPTTHQIKYEWNFDRAQTKSVIYTGANRSSVYLYPSKYGIERLTGSTTITVTQAGRYNLVVDGSRDDTPGVVLYVRATIYVDGFKTVERISRDHTHAVASVGVDLN